MFTSVVISQYTMPFEELVHEGTWLQWPHDYTYGSGANDFEPTWVEMTSALVEGEKVHIIAYDNDHESHILMLLDAAGISMDNVDIYLAQTDDFWVRDNGPIFVYDSEATLTILDWGFNGWGGNTPYSLCDVIPDSVAEFLQVPIVDLNEMVLEGGAFEIDGHGTLMATRTSITGADRNPDLTELEIEGYLEQYIGVTNFIWLDGLFGGLDDVTDQHIDGFAKFHGNNTIVTMSENDLDYWLVSQSDRNILFNALNSSGDPYDHVFLPLTQYNVTTTWGQSVGFRASYVNYYVANGVILVPNYNDPMDGVANELIQNLYPDREVVGIDCRNILLNGGMVHCITQQQPIGDTGIGIEEVIQLQEDELIRVLDFLGREVEHPQKGTLYLWQYKSGLVKKALAH
ncbi:MAG: agmatine deiminase [Bacteroidetes bacterium]|nr:MAG: agmatine deiminase [Bacteroidota bacterium]